MAVITQSNTDDILSTGRITYEFGESDSNLSGTLAYNLSGVIRDDSEVEDNEGLILYLEINEDNNPSDNFDVQAGSRAILVTITDNDGKTYISTKPSEPRICSQVQWSHLFWTAKR